MRIVKDADGDIWEEITPDYFECRTEPTASPRGLSWIENIFGPVEVFGSKASADLSVYRVTYADGRESLKYRRGLGATMGAMRNGSFGSRNQPVRVERASEIEWSDVTAEFIK